MEILSSENWSKLFTLAEYGAWCAAYPKVMNKFNSNSNMQPIQKTIESIIDGLPQNLQGVGKMLEGTGILASLNYPGVLFMRVERWNTTDELCCKTKRSS